MAGGGAQRYIGLISGTSVDGLDAALIEIDDGQAIALIDGFTSPFDADLSLAIKTLIRDGGGDFATLGDADVAVGEACAAACNELLKRTGLRSTDIAAVGSHGQTVWHAADAARPFTLQIGDPSVIAARTGMRVVGDFRRRDVAEGGEGAPLTPPFHAAAFASASERRTVINLGGIANLTVLTGDAAAVVNGAPGAEGAVRGFDSGPANALLDAWHEKHRGEPCDRDGAWARSGKVSRPLLERLLGDEYFSQPPPKSTGKERFHLSWVEQNIAGLPAAPALADVQATLAELSAKTVADAVGRHASGTARVLVCGGGVHNGFLLERLRARLGHLDVASTAGYGIAPDMVEAAAFAWLAHRRLNGLPGALASVTGASRDCVLGGVYAGGEEVGP